MQGYNFTQRVRAALADAREEAGRLRHEYVGTEHELLGLLLDDSSVATAVIASFGVSLDEVRQKIEAVALPGRDPYEPRPGLCYTSRAKKALELAMDEARHLKHSYVGTQHLLLGLIREESGVAAQVLESIGITLEPARKRVIEILDAGRQDDEGFQTRQTRADVQAWARKRASSSGSMAASMTFSTAAPMAASLIEILLQDAFVAAVFAAQGIDVAKLTAALRGESRLAGPGDSPGMSPNETPPPDSSPPAA
jgi:ATP-dependent Clp protease ATP-binding subunit ClpA